MNTRPNEFVTVHMRGLKSALTARAESERVSVSLLVRRALERELRLAEASARAEPLAEFSASVTPIVKLSIRLPRRDAEQLKTAAREAGLSHGALIIALLVQAKSPADAASHRDRVAALTSSCAELSTLGRNIGQLCSILIHGDVKAAKEYRRMLDKLGGEVRAHLRLAAEALALLPPVRHRAKDRP